MQQDEGQELTNSILSTCYEIPAPTIKGKLQKYNPMLEILESKRGL
jgi:hypothetical protein